MEIRRAQNAPVRCTERTLYKFSSPQFLIPLKVLVHMPSRKRRLSKQSSALTNDAHARKACGLLNCGAKK